MSNDLSNSEEIRTQLKHHVATLGLEQTRQVVRSVLGFHFDFTRHNDTTRNNLIPAIMTIDETFETMENAATAVFNHTKEELEHQAKKNQT